MNIKSATISIYQSMKRTPEFWKTTAITQMNNLTAQEIEVLKNIKWEALKEHNEDIVELVTNIISKQKIGD